MRAGLVLCLAAADAKRLLVGLKHGGAAAAELQRRFWAVAEHGPDGVHHSAEDLRAVLRADDAAVAAVDAWLATLGARRGSLVPTGDALVAEWPSEATRAPRVPPALRSVVDYAVLLSERAPLSETQPPLTGSVAAAANFGPAAQKVAYGVPADLKGSHPDNLQMVFGTGTFGYREDDLKLFHRTYASTSSSDDVSLDEHNAWSGDTGKNFVEGMLDVSYITAFAPGVKTIVANTNSSAATEAGEGFGAAMLAFLVDLNGRDKVPSVLSLSLGSLSFGSCDRVCRAVADTGGHSYQQCWDYMQTQFQACMFDSAEIEARIDMEFAKLGLRGTTITAASGDGGSHFAFGPFSGSLGSTVDSIICGQMNMPVYPTSSPYVLSVGGTAWSPESTYGPTCSSTKPCGWYSGGGGFSWGAPDAAPFQDGVADAYIELATKVAPKTQCASSTYNKSGRAYPDVAALSQFGIPLCTYGGCSGSGGTSASAPSVAGMLSLINDARLRAGLPTLGFVNTKLYKLLQDPESYAEAFVDIAVDHTESLWDCFTYSTCTGCESGGVGPGFPAVKGWDAMTGLGQPLFSGWLKHLGPPAAVTVV